MMDLNRTELWEGEECVSFDRTTLCLKRVAAIKWMRDRGVERVDRVSHDDALQAADAEYNRRYDTYIKDVIARNEAEGLQ